MLKYYLCLYVDSLILNILHTLITYLNIKPPYKTDVQTQMIILSLTLMLSKLLKILNLYTQNRFC